MDRGVWWARVHGVAESDMTECLILSLYFPPHRTYEKTETQKGLLLHAGSTGLAKNSFRLKKKTRMNFWPTQ